MAGHSRIAVQCERALMAVILFKRRDTLEKETGDCPSILFYKQMWPLKQLRQVQQSTEEEF